MKLSLVYQQDGGGQSTRRFVSFLNHDKIFPDIPDVLLGSLDQSIWISYSGGVRFAAELLTTDVMLPILGCDQRKKDFLENFIFKRNENNSYQRNIDQLKKTLTIATEGSDMERQFLCKSGGKQDPRPWSILSQNHVSIQRKIIIWSGNFLGFECMGSCF